MSRPYAVLDVFTDAPLAGNPLAVVREAEGLSDAQMQRIAAEFGLSETVFVLKPENPVHSARVRIFTPKVELPFAGHPTVGTAVLLALDAEGGDEQMVVLEEGVGPVRCGVSLKQAAQGEPPGGYAIFDVPRLPREMPIEGDVDAIAAALGLMPSEIGFENHRPSGFGVASGFTFVPIRNLALIARAAPVMAHWSRAFGDGPLRQTYLYTRETTAVGRQFHARMFGPGFGIGEDPATGSAAAAFAGVALKFDGAHPGPRRLIIEQGFEIGRPSLIELEMDIEGGKLAAARIGGNAVLIARGALEL